MAEYIVDTTDGIYNARMTDELVRCGECIHFERCPMRKGDGSGYCWQAKRREERNGDEGLRVDAPQPNDRVRGACVVLRQVEI